VLLDDLSGWERVLVVTAHPDDIDFGGSGTVARLVDAGSTLTYLIVTDGQAGGFDRDLDRAELPAIRRREQRAAAAEVGVEDVRFLGHMDGEVTVTLELRREISRAIREVQPQLVITMTPERNWSRIGVSHPDHLAVGEATLFAVYPDARNPFAFTELLEHQGLEPWEVDEVWLLGTEQPDTVVDITDVWQRKLGAIRAHASQLKEPDAIEVRLREWFGAVAAQAGLDAGRYAEGLRRVTTNR